MKQPHHIKGRAQDAGPSQRQLRAGELVRHALATILREEDLSGLDNSVTVSQVRLSPDLRHAICFVEALGGVNSEQMVAALNRHASFLRGRLGRMVDLKSTPDLKFVRDDSFDEAQRMNKLFEKPDVRRDLDAPESED